MPAPNFAELLQRFRMSGWRDLPGARVSATIPVAETLLNELVNASLPANVPVREVSVRPEAGNRLSVRLTPRAALLPQLTVKVEIDHQPDFPGSAVLVLRIATMPGLFGLAGAALPIGQMFPPGVRLDGERILVDLRVIATQQGFSDLLDLITRLQVTTDEGRVLIHADAATPG